MPKHYHVSLATFAEGFVLAPGRWGVQSRQFIKNGSFAPDQKSTYVLAWEAALEVARRSHKPLAPSRLDCVFGCLSLDDAEAFRDRYRAGANIYELTVPKGTPTFVGDFDKISSGGDGQTFIDNWIDASINYWVDQPVGIKELLIGGPVTIKRRV